MKKVDLKEIENWAKYFPEWRQGTIKSLIDTVRAAKLLFDFCENDLGMDKTELTMLRESLSKIEFGG